MHTSRVGVLLLSMALTLASVAAGGERRPDQGRPASLHREGRQRADQASSQRLQVTVGAYSPRRQETQGHPRDTASGEQVRSGTVALSSDVEHALGVTFGDRIMLEGLGTFVFQDRMASRKKRRVDIFMESTAAARQFGERRAFVTVAGKE